MRKRATLKDISKALNISITTVSRALNDKDDISPQTKRAVLEVARILNYKPNSLAVSLRKKSATRVIGVVLPSVDHYFYSTILNGIMTAASQQGFIVMVGESIVIPWTLPESFVIVGHAKPAPDHARVIVIPWTMISHVGGRHDHLVKIIFENLLRMRSNENV